MSETVNNQIILMNKRIARVSLAQPYIGPGAPVDPVTGHPIGKYHVDVILEPNDPDIEQIKQLMRDAITRKFKDEAAVATEQIAANNKLPLHRGDIDRAGKAEYAGRLYISANNDEQPTIVVTDKGVNIATRGTPVLLTPAHPLWPYAGSFCNVHLSIYGYNFKGAKGVGAGVMGVQFFRHGERLGGSSVSSASEFGVVAGSADAPPPGAPAKPTGGAGLI